jgi:hypothetical protein
MIATESAVESTGRVPQRAAGNPTYPDNEQTLRFFI